MTGPKKKVETKHQLIAKSDETIKKPKLTRAKTPELTKPKKLKTTLEKFKTKVKK